MNIFALKIRIIFFEFAIIILMRFLKFLAILHIVLLFRWSIFLAYSLRWRILTILIVFLVFKFSFSNFIITLKAFRHASWYLLPLAVPWKTLNIADICTLRQITTHLINWILILIHQFPFCIKLSSTRPYKCLLMLEERVLLSRTI